jgi:uncharacterized membrane protein
MTIFKQVMKWLLGVGFIIAGANHILNPGFYLKIMPGYLPWHLELVYISGVCEAFLGALVLVPRYQRAAAWGLIALLVAVFPANVQMVVHPELYAEIPLVLLWCRLPLQGLFIAWAYWFTRPAVGEPI